MERNFYKKCIGPLDSTTWNGNDGIRISHMEDPSIHEKVEEERKEKIFAIEAQMEAQINSLEEAGNAGRVDAALVYYDKLELLKAGLEATKNVSLYSILAFLFLLISLY
jgi:hypothetical protein